MNQCVNSKNKTIELWLNGEPEFTTEDAIVYFWGAAKTNNSYSILDYIEANSECLRTKYLAFIYDFGKYKLNGKVIAEHLSEQRGYNLWWMSDIAAKSYLNSPYITDCIKLLALEEILCLNDAASIVVHGKTQTSPVYKAIYSLCNNLGVSCTFLSVGEREKTSFKKIIRHFIPEIFFVLRYLFRYVKKHLRLFNEKNISWFCDSNSIMFFSYFFHLDVDKCKKGQFYSKQWGKLPSVLMDRGLTINFMHHFYEMDNIKMDITWIDDFNIDSMHQGKHALFENYLNLTLISHAFLNYCRLYLKSSSLFNIRKAFLPKDSKVDFWPLLKNDWRVSLRGGTAMRNCLFIEAVDNVLKTIPRQRLGLYIQENMYWERALLHGWRLHGHGKIIGVPLATINFWDLRYAEDERSINVKEEPLTLQKPDVVALHGPVAKEHYSNTGYPVVDTADVEALRYLYLDKKQKVKINTAKNDKIKILILGEIKADATMEILTAVQDAVVNRESISITLKPHPVCPINLDELDKLGVSIVYTPIEKILNDYDLVIIAGTTSAAIDAYYAGVNLIVFLGENELNLSPLRGIEGVEFVRTSGELKVAIDSYRYSNIEASNKVYFYIDNDLPRWCSLIMNYISI